MANGLVFNVPVLTEELTRALTDEVGQGKQIMRDIIDTSGLGVEWKTWHNGRNMSSPGRVDTGLMGDSVDASIEREANGATGKFGWINRWEDYFGYQDEGFFHNQAGREIRGMYALQDAADQVMENLERRIDEVLRAL